MVVIDMIKGNTKVAWHMQDIILNIRQLLQHVNSKIQHCYQEANQVADALAKWGIKEYNSFFFSLRELPKHAAGSYLLNKAQMASIRHKQRRNMLVSSYFWFVRW